MPKYHHLDELPAWQMAARLYNQVLDLFETHASLSTPSFRNQLDRAALSVPNNVAEGFDRGPTLELIAFLGYARRSAGEVRSMILVVINRPKLRPVLAADSCIRQLAAWTTQIESGPIQDKRPIHPRSKKGTPRQ